MSDALGSMVKRRSNDSALRQRISPLNEEGINEILEDMESGMYSISFSLNHLNTKNGRCSSECH